MTLRRRSKLRRLRTVLLLGMAMVSGGAAFAAAPASRPTTVPSVRELILQVDSDSFAVRRAATLRLNSLPGYALPAVEEAVKSSAVGPEGMLRLQAALKYLRPRAHKLAQVDARDAWEQEQIRGDYQRAGLRGAWDDLALAAIDSYFDWRKVADRTGLPSAAAAARAASVERFGRAVKAGCRDPLVLSLYHLSVGSNTPVNHGPVPETFGQTSAKVAKGGYGALAKLMVRAEVVKMTHAMSAAAMRDAIEQLTALSKAPGLPETELDWCVGRIHDAAAQTGEDSLVTQPMLNDAYAKLAPGSARPLYIKAHSLVNKANRYVAGARSRDEIPAVKWNAFCDSLSRAGAELEKAWKMDPGDSRVASLMITVQFATGSREEMEKWFARAVQVDPDNLDAYRLKLNFLTPVWYGSPEEMVQFGRDCLRTENWRGGIPLLLVGAHRAAADTSGDVKTYYMRPDVWQDLSTVYEGHLLTFPEDVRRRSEFVVVAARAEKWDVVREQLDALGDRADLATFGGKATVDYYREKAIRRTRASAHNGRVGEPTPAPAAAHVR